MTVIYEDKSNLRLYKPKGRFFWYAFVAISKQCVNAFEICQGHLPT